MLKESRMKIKYKQFRNLYNLYFLFVFIIFSIYISSLLAIPLSNFIHLFLYFRNMKNSRVKNQRQTSAFLSSDYAIFDRDPCPEVKQLAKPQFNSTSHNYQQNYHYFLTRISQQKTDCPKTSKTQYQRYASMDNSRASALNINQDQQSVVNSTSSPYLLQAIINKDRPHQAAEQRPKMIAFSQATLGLKNSQQNKSGKQKKVSMRNTVNKNNFGSYGGGGYDTPSAKDSGISTHQETIKSGNIDQLMKLVSNRIQRWIEELRNQINDQSRTIESLNDKMRILNNKLRCKQEQMRNLVAYYSEQIFRQKMTPGDVFKTNTNTRSTQNTQIIQNKLYRLEQILKNVIYHSINQQNKYQCEINKKIQEIMGKLMIIIQARQQTHQLTTLLNENVKQAKIKFNEANSYIHRNIFIVNGIYEVSDAVKSVVTQAKLVKDMLSKIKCQNQTDCFNFPDLNYQQKTKRNNPDLNESASYFFHPSELANIDKITQLFINRQGQPIQCYVDRANQVKYKDTNTYMFDKKGDIVRLTDSEKRYYMDKGFISGKN